jgi:hypothetical protein
LAAVQQQAEAMALALLLAFPALLLAVAAAAGQVNKPARLHGQAAQVIKAQFGSRNFLMAQSGRKGQLGQLVQFRFQ